MDSIDWAPEHEIARVEHPDSYENSGVIAVVQGNNAAILTFSHCSCYGTWNSPGSGWEGSLDGLKELAINGLDYDHPGRPFNSKDYDHKDTEALYKLIREKYDLPKKY